MHAKTTEHARCANSALAFFMIDRHLSVLLPARPRAGPDMASQDEDDDESDEFDPSAASIFWLEAGYITPNRGPNRPGNQIDFPRGITARYFGFNPPDGMAANSVIGPVSFVTPVAGPVVNNLRLGNNMMEKISLPIPETHGFDIYDGKVLVFRRSGGRFVLNALEADDFESAFGDELEVVRVMGSGRQFGFID